MRQKNLWMVLLLLIPMIGITDPIYRWTDKDGTVHFSSKPVNSVTDHEMVNLETSPATPTPEAEPEPEAAEEKQAEPAPPSPTPEEVQARIEHCNKLKNNLGMLENSPRVRIKRDDDDELDILNDQQRQEQIDKTKKQLAEDCS